MEILLLLLALGIYFLPTFVGTGKRNINAIFLLNLLLGWSIIGWVVALVWATTKEPAATIATKPATPIPAPSPHSATVLLSLEARTARLKTMRDNGTLTQEEFMEQVAKLA